MKIREYKKTDKEKIKDLLVELQKYIVEIDKYKLNIISPKYRDKYLKYMIKECLKNNGKILIAEKNNVILGLIAGYVDFYKKHNYENRMITMFKKVK